MSIGSLILTAKQIEATNLMATYQNVLLEGGSRSGKTLIFLRNMIIRAMHYPNTWHVALRLRFKHARQSLWNQTMPKLVQLMGLSGQFKYNNSDLMMTFPHTVKGVKSDSYILVGGLDDKVRVEKILGNEFATIYVNEASQIAYDSVETLMTRLNPPKGVPPRFWQDYNPPSKQHWGYKVYHDRKFPDGRIVPADDFKWLKLNPTDNEENISETLIKTLSNLSGAKRIRFLEGGYSSDDGALWKRRWIKYKIAPATLIRVAIGVDPSGSLEGDEIGIIVAGMDRDKNIYIMYDGSLNGSPKEWSDGVHAAYRRFKADVVAAEKNFGGDMVEAVITQFGDNDVNVKLVNATRGKAVRAEPVAALYEKGRVFHTEPLTALEDEICTWKPADIDGIDNRMDALVWAVTELMSDEFGEAAEEIYENGVDNLW